MNKLIKHLIKFSTIISLSIGLYACNDTSSSTNGTNGTSLKNNLVQATGATSESSSSFAQYAYIIDSPNNAIYTYQINNDDGSLESTVFATVATGNNPTSITVSPNSHFSYVTNKNDSTISMYSINQTFGSLVSLGSIATSPSPTSIVVSSNNQHVYVSSSTSNNISVFDISESGTLSPNTTVTAIGNSNSLAIESGFLYVGISPLQKGSANLEIFSINSDGSLTSVNTLTAGSSNVVLSGSPNGQFLYAGNQYATDGTSSSSNLYSYLVGADGKLSGSEVVNGGQAIYALNVSPNNQFLFSADFYGSCISSFSIEPTYGSLTPVESSASTPNLPTDMAIDATGQYLYATLGYTSTMSSAHSLAIYHIESSGTLTAISSSPSTVASKQASAIAIASIFGSSFNGPVLVSGHILSESGGTFTLAFPANTESSTYEANTNVQLYAINAESMDYTLAMLKNNPQKVQFIPLVYLAVAIAVVAVYEVSANTYVTYQYASVGNAKAGAINTDGVQTTGGENEDNLTTPVFVANPSDTGLKMIQPIPGNIQSQTVSITDPIRLEEIGGAKFNNKENYGPYITLTQTPTGGGTAVQVMPQVGAFKGLVSHSLTINHGVFNRDADVTVAVTDAPASICTNTDGCKEVELSSGTQTFHTENGIKNFTATSDSSGTTFTFELDGIIDPSTVDESSIVITTLGGAVSVNRPTANGNTLTTRTDEIISGEATGEIDGVITNTAAAPIVAEETAPVEPPPIAGRKLIYQTTPNYTGNLGGVAGADTICNNDANRPADIDLPPGQRREYGAMIYASTRYACEDFNTGEIDCAQPQQDWVLRPGITYYNSPIAPDPIGTTNGDAVFRQARLTSRISTDINFAYTGIYGYDDKMWVYDRYNNNCNDWTSNSRNMHAIIGTGAAWITSHVLQFGIVIDEVLNTCEDDHAILCAQTN